jgi:TolB-like protein
VEKFIEFSEGAMNKITVLLLCLGLCGCATHSVRINHPSGAKPLVAVLSLDGPHGEQASDYITEQLAVNGILPIERTQLDAILTEHGYRGNKNFNQETLADYGRLLGVKKVFIGTISEISGPLYSFPHVNITLKLVDVSTGSILWIGHYGNSLWTSAISTQGDIQRGAKWIVHEFIKIYGLNLES